MKHILGLCDCHISILSVIVLAVIIKYITNEPTRYKRFLPTYRND